jgi:hypothetical protein
MRITSRFLEDLILLPSSRPALCVYRVILQGLGLRSVEEGLLTWDGCEAKRQTCQEIGNDECVIAEQSLVQVRAAMVVQRCEQCCSASVT